MSIFRRNTIFTIALLASAGGIAGCATAAHHEGHGAGKPIAKAKLVDAQGRDAGTVVLAADGDAIKGMAQVKGIAAGAHGIHIHTTGKCEGPAFTSAGGHLNPDGKKHGLQNPEGSHQGDLPDLVVAADGTGKGSFTAHTSVASLFDADGSAVVVHAAPDDGKTDPSGNSGARLLCGVLEKAS